MSLGVSVSQICDSNCHSHFSLRPFSYMVVSSCLRPANIVSQYSQVNKANMIVKVCNFISFCMPLLIGTPIHIQFSGAFIITVNSVHSSSSDKHRSTRGPLRVQNFYLNTTFLFCYFYLNQLLFYISVKC